MTAKELMKKHSLEGAILEPAPYYWERVELAINEALGEVERLKEVIEHTKKLNPLSHAR